VGQEADGSKRSCLLAKFVDVEVDLDQHQGDVCVRMNAKNVFFELPEG
jgi:hypothetical protein